MGGAGLALSSFSCTWRDGGDEQTPRGHHRSGRSRVSERYAAPVARGGWTRVRHRQAGNRRLIGRSFLGGTTRSKHNRRAVVSPARASSIAFRVSASAHLPAMPRPQRYYGSGRPLADHQDHQTGPVGMADLGASRLYFQRSTSPLVTTTVGPTTAAAELCTRLSDADLVGSEETRRKGFAYDVPRHPLDAPRMPALESRISRGGVNVGPRRNFEHDWPTTIARRESSSSSLPPGKERDSDSMLPAKYSSIEVQGECVSNVPR